MRLCNTYLSIVVENNARYKLTRSSYLDSHLLVLECKWKHSCAYPFFNLFTWDRGGEALSYQYKSHIHNLKSRPEFERCQGEAMERLCNVQLEVPSQLGYWFGQFCETMGPQSTSTQLELICDSNKALVSYCHVSFMESSTDSIQRVRSMLASLKVSSQDQWNDSPLVIGQVNA